MSNRGFVLTCVHLSEDTDEEGPFAAFNLDQEGVRIALVNVDPSAVGEIEIKIAPEQFLAAMATFCHAISQMQGVAFHTRIDEQLESHEGIFPRRGRFSLRRTEE